MSGIKFSDLTITTSLSGEEIIPILQTGSNKATTLTAALSSLQSRITVLEDLVHSYHPPTPTPTVITCCPEGLQEIITTGTSTPVIGESGISIQGMDANGVLCIGQAVGGVPVGFEVWYDNDVIGILTIPVEVDPNTGLPGNIMIGAEITVYYRFDNTCYSGSLNAGTLDLILTEQ